MNNKYLEESLAALLAPTRWAIADKQVPGQYPRPWLTVLASALLGAALWLAGLAVGHIVRRPALAPLLAAVAVCLLHGWLNNWRQAKIAETLATLLTGGDNSTSPTATYRSTLVILLQLIRPAIYFLLFRYGAGAWLLASFALGEQFALEGTPSADRQSLVPARALAGILLFLAAAIAGSGFLASVLLLVFGWLLSYRLLQCKATASSPALLRYCGEMLVLLTVVICFAL
jgi:hypothetical protein